MQMIVDELLEKIYEKHAAKYISYQTNFYGNNIYNSCTYYH